jgi:very-short-patch-repair endonuclease
VTQTIARIDEIARVQHGVVTRAQALEAGLSERSISNRIKSGAWKREVSGVFCLRAIEPTWLTRLMATCLSLEAVASHRSAARLWDIDGFDSARREVTISRAGGRTRSGVTVHESTQNDGSDTLVRRNVPCATVGRTILDLGAVVSVRRVEWAMDDVLRRELLTLADLEATLARRCRKGRNGCGPLRELLEERTGSERVPDSKWNRMVARLLVDAGLPRPDLELPVRVGGRPYRVDLAYPEQRVAIELDSVRWHLNRESFDADAVKRNDLGLAGWRVLTFTYRTFRERPERLCASVRAALNP